MSQHFVYFNFVYLLHPCLQMKNFKYPLFILNFIKLFHLYHKTSIIKIYLIFDLKDLSFHNQLKNFLDYELFLLLIDVEMVLC